MFLNYFKNLFLKYTLRNKWREVSSSVNSGTVKKVGLLIDASVFVEKEKLIHELIAKGFDAKNLEILVYKDRLDKRETEVNGTFDLSVVDWKGTIYDARVNEFVQTKFDLLISYYEIEKAILLLITNNSKANFKVGFSSIDKRLHHLSITTPIQNYSIFVHELFKYLKILNKIDF